MSNVLNNVETLTQAKTIKQKRVGGLGFLAVPLILFTMAI